MQEALTQREHIQGIQAEYLQSSPIALDSLTGAIDRLQKAFPKRGHFFMEFIQNADDAKSTKMTITMTKDTITIRNDGEPFGPKDVNSICRVGRSSKTPEDYIGYLGIGFKSVFLISDSPAISSGGYMFKFDKKFWEDKNVKGPWQIIPVWLEDSEDNSIEGWKTSFIIPISNAIDEELLGKIRAELSVENLTNHVLMFLKHLDRIEIEDSVSGTRRIITKSILTSKENYAIYGIREQKSDDSVVEEKWLVFRASRDVPDEVKSDIITKDWERQDVTKREIVVAFRLTADDVLVEERGTTHVGVFSFKPLKQSPSGLKFLVQADFLTGSGREVMLEDAKWNEWLAKKIVELLSTTCAAEFLKHEKWKLNFTTILQPGDWGHPVFDQFIKRPLVEFLSKGNVLIAEDGSPVKPSEAISLDSGVRILLTQEDLTKIYPSKKVLHAQCIPGDATDVPQGPSSVLEFLASNEGAKIATSKAAEGKVDWFKGAFKALKSVDKSELTSLRYVKCVPKTDGTLAEPYALYTNLGNVDIPKEVAASFPLVKGELVSDPDVRQVLANLEIPEVSTEMVQGVLSQKALPTVSKDWPTLDNDKKLQKLRELKELWSKKKITSKEVSFLTLKTKSGKWVKPSEILFSAEYNPPHRLEGLANKGLLDTPTEFLTADFAGKQDTPEWYTFLKELGVDSIAGDVNKMRPLVQRIGINVALQYEKTQGRDASELGESVKPGYDIVSKSTTEERHIEVKGSADSSSSVFVTGKEFLKLRADEKNYHVYIVANTKNAPVLYPITGSKILGIDYSVSLDAKQWKKLSDGEYPAQF